jgi:peptidoglycan-associated lipoprotein
MKLKIISVLSGSLLLAACSSTQDGAGSKMGEAPAIPGSVEDFNRNVKHQAFFDFDKSNLNAEAQGNMMTVVDWTKKYPQSSLTVEGNCDERGTSEYNLALGERRAVAAKKFLAAHHVGAKTLHTVSYGKNKLPGGAGNDTGNRVANVEIK